LPRTRRTRHPARCPEVPRFGAMSGPC
jgi:hypothetical protein